MSTYNLLREPWLPVVRADGNRASVALSSIGDSALVRIDTGRGDFDIALTELLIGLLAVALDPMLTKKKWMARWRSPPGAQELESAFAPFTRAFELDGSGARFFQDLEELQAKTEPVAALLIDAPAEHFVKPGGIRVLSRRGAAMALATLQTGAPAGGAGHRTGLRGGGPLSTLVVPGVPDGEVPTLWRRLWTNVPERYGATPADLDGVFPWLVPTRISDKTSTTLVTTPAHVHKAQAFFGLPRRIRLKFEPNTERSPCDLTGDVDDVIVREYVTKPWGTNYEGWGKEHPLSPSYKQKATDVEYLPVHLKTARVGYRQWLGCVFSPNPAEPATQDTLPAAAITTFISRKGDLLPEDPLAVDRARLLTAGYYLDKMKPLEFGEALLPLSVATSDNAPLAALIAHAWVEAAEEAAWAIGTAVKQGLYDDNPNVGPGSAILENAKTRFWGETELAFFAELESTVKGLDGIAEDAMFAYRTSAGMRWLARMRRAALTIFDEVVPIDTADLADPDDYKRIVDARSDLTGTFAGIGKVGARMFRLLDLEPPKSKRGNRPQETTP